MSGSFDLTFLSESESQWEEISSDDGEGNELRTVIHRNQYLVHVR